YGCDVGSGAEGEELIADLAQYTGADVAAATHDVGSADQGASWTLDTSTGPIETDAPFTAEAMASFQDVLANTTLTTTQTTVLATGGDLDGDGVVDPGNPIVPTAGDKV